jgi:hypothetical protein
VGCTEGDFYFSLPISRNLSVPQDLAPSRFRGLPGIAGPVPPPLLIRSLVFNFILLTILDNKKQFSSTFLITRIIFYTSRFRTIINPQNQLFSTRKRADSDEEDENNMLVDWLVEEVSGSTAPSAWR